jgi:PmbA protein
VIPKLLQEHAEKALEAMQGAGFDQAQATVRHVDFDELGISNNEVPLFRSVNKPELLLKGILDGRKASQTLGLPDREGLSKAVEELKAAAMQAPQDEANQVSADTQHDSIKGPMAADKDKMVERLRELLTYRAEKTPKAVITEGALQYKQQQKVILTSGGVQLRSKLGWYEGFVLVVGQEEGKSSSMNYTFGRSEDLDRPLVDCFGIEALLHEAARQVHTEKIAENFTGSVLLTPFASMELLTWLAGQVGDSALLSDSSIYKERVGEDIASPLLSIRHSISNGAAICPHTDDGYVLEDFNLLEKGVLKTLLPSNYTSRKLGLSHRPSGGAYSIAQGETAMQKLVQGMDRGAVVGRISMGRPVANGDFSGVIKNSFHIENGKVGTALNETMISGNLASMLNSIDGISIETVDYGTAALPWIRIPGLVFS